MREHSLVGTRALIWAPCPGKGTSSRGSTRVPCPGTGTSLNRFSSVPAVFTFPQAVEASELQMCRRFLYGHDLFLIVCEHARSRALREEQALRHFTKEIN